MEGPPAQAPSEPTPHGIFIATGPDEIYMAGDGLTVTFAPVTPGPPMVGLGTVEESHFEAGHWARGRAPAGDETGQGNDISLHGGRGDRILRISLYRHR
ncbi:MAG: DUF5597 domain-containing protein [Acidobacteriota bacterium]